VQPGERALAELVLDEPMLAKHGDRVVIRDHALERTLGGGAIIDNRPATGRRRAPARLRGIAACALSSPEATLAALLTQGPVHVQSFERLWNLSPNDVDEVLAGAGAARHDDWLVAEPLWRHWHGALLDECLRRHERDPALQGLRENEFEAPVPGEFRARVLGELAAAGHLDRRSGRYLPRRHRAALSAAERNLLDRLRPLLDQTQPPSLGDLGRTLHMPLMELKGIVKALASKGALVQVNDKRVYLPQHLDALARSAEGLSRSAPFTAREFRDAAAIGRNVAIDVLEYFDAKGFTRRQGETRVVVGERSRLPGELS